MKANVVKGLIPALACALLLGGCAGRTAPEETAAIIEQDAAGVAGETDAAGVSAETETSEETAAGTETAEGQRGQTDEETGEAETAERQHGQEAETAAVELAAAPQTQAAGPLSPKELAFFTDYLNNVENNGFLCSSYETVEDADLNEIFYNGAGISQPLSPEIRQAYEAAYGEIMTDVVCLSTQQLQSFLLKKTGHPVTDFNQQLVWPWLEEYDLYMAEHGDTNQIRIVCQSGLRDANGKVILTCVDPEGEEYSWIAECTVTLQQVGEDYRFCSNLITKGLWVDCHQPESGKSEGFDPAQIADFDTTADISGLGQWGDWSEITKERLYGTWYAPSDPQEYLTVLVLSEEGAYVYYPALGIYGDELYDWEVEDRSARGLCPALKIYFSEGGGPLAYYIAGVKGRVFWCNAQQEIFYKQGGEL